VLNALGLARGARGVEEVQHVLRVHLLGGAIGLRALHKLVPPHVAARLHVHDLTGAFEHNHRAQVRAFGERLVHVLLEGHGASPTPPPSAVRRTVDCASWIRSRTASGAKPPKITL